MGYRGSVAIAIKETDYQKFVQKIEALRVNDKEFYSMLDDLVFNSPTNDYIVKKESIEYRILSWEEIKWYEGEKDIDFVMRYLRSLTDYQFVNVGMDWEEQEGDLELLEPYTMRGIELP